MKLQELAKNKTQQVSKVMEGHFNAKIDVTKLNLEQAKTLLAKTSAIIAEVQSSTQRHTSQQNPTYLKALMMHQALKEYVESTSMKNPYAGGTGDQGKIMPSNPTQGITDEDDDELFGEPGDDVLYGDVGTQPQISPDFIASALGLARTTCSPKFSL